MAVCKHYRHIDGKIYCAAINDRWQNGIFRRCWCGGAPQRCEFNKKFGKEEKKCEK